MQEKFLYFLWKFQYFTTKDLYTCNGEKLDIIVPGTQNEHSGPDFINAHIIIDSINWYGHIEIHINASDWYTHSHHTDKAYENVVLHVVWNNDKTINHPDGISVPTLELKDLVSSGLCKKYHQFEQTKLPIPCAHHLSEVPKVIKNAMFDKALYQRMLNKNNLVYQLLRTNTGDWYETAYQLLGYNFGFKMNNETFLQLAQSIPIKTILKNKTSILQLEAILFGMSGLLPIQASKVEYIEALQKEFALFQHKEYINKQVLCKSQWKFFRLRPANFPTIRIAQFAQIMHQNNNLFDTLISTPTKEIYKLFAITQSTYWQNHYNFYKKSSINIPGLGLKSIDNILINTIVPLLVAYGKTKDNQDYIDRATAILEYLPPENNKITRMWKDNGIKVKNAFDSQASIELYNSFCSQKKCLSCSIGIDIIRKE
jgi:hypothetical protein